jgi:hypothetical protein
MRKLLGPSISLFTLMLACGGGGGSTPVAQTPPPAPGLIYQTAFGGQADLYALRLDGKPAVGLATLNQSESFIALVGDRVIFERYDSGASRSIRSVRLDGSGEALLGAAVDNPSFGLSANGRVFLQKNISSIPSLVGMNPDGTGATTYFSSNDLSGARAVVGDRLIFDRIIGGKSVLNSVKLDNTGLYTLPSANSVIFRGVMGTQILVGIQGPAPVGSANEDLYKINADTSGLAPVINSADNELFQDVVGDRIIFTKKVGLYLHSFSVKMDGTGLVDLAGSTDQEIYQGAAGNRLIMRRQQFSGSTAQHGDLISVNPDGSSPVALAQTSENEIYRAYVNGRIIFERRSAGVTSSTYSTLYSVLPDGSDVRRLSNAGVVDFYEGTTGGLVVFGEFDQATMSQRDVWVVNVDGSNLRPLLNSTKDEIFVSAF